MSGRKRNESLALIHKKSGRLYEARYFFLSDVYALQNLETVEYFLLSKKAVKKYYDVLEVLK